ncbi:MAG: sigma-70 family RNA polymerase sigma factor [Acidobacteriota bacterium]
MTWRDLTLADAEAMALATTTTCEDHVAFVMSEDEFRLFYDRNARPLWAYLSRLTGDRSAADDLLQESFYRFLRANAALDNDAHRKHYLYRIATNLVRDGYRQAKTRPNTTEHDVELLESRVDHGGDAHVRVDLNRAMAQLKPRERAMLWLAYAQGSSHREIAAVVGVKAESVKPLLFRARRKLAELLGGSR